MKPHPENLMTQHALFIEALCDDWMESGIVSLDPQHTPRANRVMEISRQFNRDGVEANNLPPSNQ